jgi:hypothetical protein
MPPQDKQQQSDEKAARALQKAFKELKSKVEATESKSKAVKELIKKLKKWGYFGPPGNGPTKKKQTMSLEETYRAFQRYERLTLSALMSLDRRLDAFKGEVERLIVVRSRMSAIVRELDRVMESEIRNEFMYVKDNVDAINAWLQEFTREIGRNPSDLEREVLAVVRYNYEYLRDHTNDEADWITTFREHLARWKDIWVACAMGMD